ncbi:hypothetical protein [Oleisolibacter albus]|uniref:hypothetical protein n=1 Tax=Oleisolibacter albus TaxID=2171757 RepID=UPI0012D8249D|nr:hypothetical protein [Oleisolibacter albus]
MGLDGLIQASAQITQQARAKAQAMQSVTEEANNRRQQRIMQQIQEPPAAVKLSVDMIGARGAMLDVSV